MKARLAFLAALALSAGCAPAIGSSSTPSISRVLRTPTDPLTYGWLMARSPGDGAAWGVQIGPKVDAGGTHVAVYGWQNCVRPTPSTPATSCGWQWFQEYDALTPGSEHSYSIVWGPGGWQVQYEGRTLVVLDPGGPTPAVTESNCCERTSA